MDGGTDPDASIDYVELQIFPSQNRYEACVWSRNRAEKVASGPLEYLLLHSPQVKDLYTKGSDTNFKILPPENVDDAEWFKTATLTRFLHIVSSPEIISIGNEISQLEVTRKFQLSLSAKVEVDLTSSVESKNELLRAVDLRLMALKEELGAAFTQATCGRCSTKDISDLQRFAHHFGAKDIRDSLQKFVEISPLIPVKDSNNNNFTKTERGAPTPQPSQLDLPVKYGVSPAKVAQVERQSSTDSDNSSVSSEEDQPSVERSRTLTRSATPRRSASPMRRIQIGRSGSRRAPTLSIKSLNYFPARVSQRDVAGNSSEEEDSEKPPKNNVLRMSVQDKISLFESKQRDQGVDIQKTKTLLNANIGSKKVLLRRWSSGMGENAAQTRPDTSAESSASPISPKNVDPDGKEKSDICVSKSQTSVESGENIKSPSPERGVSEPLGVKMDTLEPEIEGSGEKHPASLEWSQQKEAELNQLFTKMMESKPVRQRNVTNDTIKNKTSPKEQRGGFYDHYKQKRDEKLRGEATGKKAEKEAQFKVMQQFLHDRKAEMASTNVTDVNRSRNTVNKPQKTQKNSTHLTNFKKEASKPSVKATSKPSATRKSWPSTPSPRATGASPARTPTRPSSISTTPTSRKPQPASSVQSSRKVEKSQPRSKTLKATQPDVNKSTKTVNEKKQPIVTKNTKTPKSKVRTPEVDTTAITTTTTKPSFYNKVTRKNSVVPLETKPFLRKGSGAFVIKTKVVAQPEETFRSSGVLVQAEDSVGAMATDITGQKQEKESEVLETHATKDFEPQVVSLSPTKCEESNSSNQFNVSGDDGLQTIEMPEINTRGEEESGISPIAWVETEEEHQQDEEIIACKENPSPANVGAPAGSSSPRVRHSLSQMLLEDSTEADIGEWGNAEHPPSIAYQKDAPKGFKRLLKFARKTKPDSHLTGWSSPSAFSEEDDAEESKGQSNISRFTSQNHQKMPEGHVSASLTTTKATRSFFSLSAFRPSKTNETKLPYQ